MSSGTTSAEIYITFNEVPPFSETVNGKRIDIILDASLSNTEPLIFQTDDRVVKFLTQEKQDQTILTFFLRYEPQKVELNRPQKNTLVLDILLGNQFTKAYPELTTKLEGLSLVKKQGKDLSNPYVASPYSNNWRSFFSRYEPDVITTAPLRYTTPPFPIIELLPDVNSSDILPAEVFSLSADEQWKDLIPLLMNQIPLVQDPFSQKLLALVFGEVLARANDYQNAYKQLFLLAEKYNNEYVGIAASYILAILRAEHEDPYIADYQLKNIEQHIDPRFALSPFIILSQIETALTTDQLERAAELLQRDDIGFPPRIAQLRQMRQADYWFASQSYIKAYVGYQLLEDKKILEEYPFSLNGYCNALYHQKKFAESANCFDQLSTMVQDKKYLSLISLKKTMAELHFMPAREMYVSFSRIEDTYPDTSAGLRAALKKTDIRYLSQPSWRKSSAAYYKDLAQNSTDRKVAEEAALKEAIVHAELEESEEAIDLLLDFLRDFRAGSLNNTAQALLIEILPDQLEKLLSNKKYVEAIVLAKKNREFFQKNWIDVEMLGLLAKAYHELGIFNEAQKLYVFLLRTTEEEEKEHYYLPLVSILYSQGKYELVEDFATEYRYNYPGGAEREKINLLLLRSLVSQDKKEEAMSLLDTPLPNTTETMETVATLYFTDNQYRKALDSLLPALATNETLSDDSIFIIAESFYQSDDPLLSQKYFQKIMDNPKFFEQARYRLAQLERMQGKEESSLKLFQEIVEKGKDPLWKRLAQKEIELKEFDKKLY